ncbi:hypothetical protein FFLO_03094 [Filobasidium floriforme]|uniref:Uncharacterized protein n=1 Tax=Filobasidium floriforme TaxID=5210 RepID=A0A8K0NR75_9TREE|nr:uncharacterized protein HD553DRAFT_325034 [Filobasidium floriforme]KAG7549058.1 hypothetical protein FFLO_03094 [Filobasidium floriforme]KAH8082174.1 hypothetical protein HD553DRAFT_325034 [Filobasidium floriforme]
MASQQGYPSDPPPSYEISLQPILELNASPTDDKDMIASIKRKKFCIKLGKQRKYYEWFLEGTNICSSVFKARVAGTFTGSGSLEVRTRQNVNFVFASMNEDMPQWFYSAVDEREPENLRFYRKQNEDCRLAHGYAPLPKWTAALDVATIAFPEKLDLLFATSGFSTNESDVVDRLTRECGSQSNSAAFAALQQMSIGTDQPDGTYMTASAETSNSKSSQSNGCFSGLRSRWKRSRGV